MYTEAFDRDTGLQRWDSGLWIRFKLFENCLDTIPAADVVEVVHARPVKFYCDARTGRMMTTCSACDMKIGPYDSFCKHCGAKMDGGQDDV